MVNFFLWVFGIRNDIADYDSIRPVRWIPAHFYSCILSRSPCDGLRWGRNYNKTMESYKTNVPRACRHYGGFYIFSMAKYTLKMTINFNKLYISLQLTSSATFGPCDVLCNALHITFLAVFSVDVPTEELCDSKYFSFFMMI